MNTGPGATGLLWLWAVVAELGPGDSPEPPSRPAPTRDHEIGVPIATPIS